ncbi:hypothetical protein VTN96DRAFT_1584 [Rasamsonia emersonii]
MAPPWKTELLAVFFILCALPRLAQAATSEEWKSRSIYQIVTDRFARSDNSTVAPCNAAAGEYCGGDFRGIINKLDYIQDLGFSAIWISPVTYPVQQDTPDLSSYHGYWQQDIYRINPRFGTPDDLKTLSDELHARGMYLMLDVVTNHFAWAGNYTTIDYSQFHPFNRQDYFHPFRLLKDDPDNETCVIDCWLGDEIVTLPDLRTEDSNVASTLYSWIGEMVSNYSIDGLRLDSVFNVNQDFWPGFNKASGVFCIGEGITDSASSICPLQWKMDGVLNYPMYYRLTGTFNNTNANMNDLLEGLEEVKSACRDIFTLGIFTENQDVPRFASQTQDISLARNIITFNLLGDGIPILYYGEELHLQGPYNPVNRGALWLTDYATDTTSLPSLVQSLNRLRAHAAGNGTRFTESSPSSSQQNDYLTFVTYAIHNTSHTVALRKGFAGNQVITVLSNLGSQPSRDDPETSFTLPSAGTGFHPNQNVTEILSCRTVLTDGAGNLNVDLSADGGPRVYYPTNSLNGSGLCSDELKSKSSAASPVTFKQLIWLTVMTMLLFLMTEMTLM